MRPTDSDHRRAGSPVNRRTLLAAGTTATVALAAGCTLNNPFNSDKTPAVEAASDLSPDVALAVAAVGALLLAQRSAERAVAAFPGLADDLAAVLALHRAHVDALEDAVPSTVDPAPSTPGPKAPADRRTAVKQQQVAEQKLHDQLAGFALRAESGPFARLLGSMAAATAQQIAAAR